MSEVVFGVSPVAWVRTSRARPIDDDWGEEVAELELGEEFTAEAFLGLSEFSHIEVVFLFDRVDPEEVNTSARHPRGRADWPRVGVFAQRNKSRPNRLGVSRCELLEVRGRTLRVRGLDAIDGTPVLDIKPWFQEFAPRQDVEQPAWTHELMRGYY